MSLRETEGGSIGLEGLQPPLKLFFIIMDFGGEILWFCGFYRMDPLVLGILTEVSSGFVSSSGGLLEGSSGFVGSAGWILRF